MFFFVCFFTNPSSAIPNVDLLIQCLSSSSHGATECIFQNDTLPRQLQKTMCTLMSFRLSTKQNSPSETEGICSSSSCIVLDGWDSAKSKHWFPLLSSWDPSWVSLKRHGAIFKIWFQYPNYLHFIWLDAICFSSANGMLYGWSATL